MFVCFLFSFDLLTLCFVGLYAESKVGLEPLFNKWKSESWGQYISLVGAVIGYDSEPLLSLGLYWQF